METICLDGQSLTFEQVQAVVYGKLNAPHVEISDAAKKLVTRISSYGCGR